MAMRSRLALSALLLGLLGPAARGAEPPALRIIAPTNLTEPLVRFEAGQLRGGLLKELGDALARQLGRPAHYLSLPSKRVGEALRSGEGQLVCYVMPGWIDGDFDWSLPVIPNAEVIAARPEAPPLRSIADLAGQRVGTVLGYRYTHLFAEGASRLPFERFDAPDTRANLAKLAAGRMNYAVVDELALRDFQRRQPDSGLKLALLLSRYTAQCALSRGAGLSIEELNRALQTLQQDGSLARLLQRR